MSTEFSISTVSEVKNKCKLFMRDLHLTAFNYGRIYKDNSILAVHTDKRFAQAYLELNCPPIAPIPDTYWKYKSFYYLPRFGADDRYNLILKNDIALNAVNSLYLIAKKQNYIEVAAISSGVGDHDAVARYLNHMNEIQFLIESFREENDYLFKKAESYRLYLPPHLQPKIPTTLEIDANKSIYDSFYTASSERNR